MTIKQQGGIFGRNPTFNDVNVDGSIGVGTDDPVGILDTVSAGNNIVRARSSDSTGVVGFMAQNTTTGTSITDGMFVGIDGSEQGYCYHYEEKPLIFGTDNTEAMRIDDLQNLLIGTTDNTLVGRVDRARLCVDNEDGHDCIQIKGSGSNHLNIASWIPVTGAAYHIGFGSGTSSYTEHGVISTNGTSTTYGTSSDYRLKENVTDMTGAITRVKALEPKRFNFISDDTNTLVDGFLAHEVQTTVPEAIIGTHDGQDADGNPIYQHIDQSKLVPLLTGALKEAIAKIESLEARVTALE